MSVFNFVVDVVVVTAASSFFFILFEGETFNFVHVGIPNKEPEEIPDYDGTLGFSLVGPSVRMPKEECLTDSGNYSSALLLNI